MKKLILLLTILLSVSAFAEEKNGIIYVKAGGTGTGTSWTDAIGDIQTAINTAKAEDKARKDVWIAAGEYMVSTCIVLADSVNVYGSFAGTESAVSERTKKADGEPWEFENPTILKGDNSRLIEMKANFDMPTIVDGLVLTDGNGHSVMWNNNGGAAVLRNNIILSHCIVKNSQSLNGAGGGINMTGGTIHNCLIYGNKQSVKANGGGGIYINTSQNNETTIENCRIEKNHSTVRGGAINVQGKGYTHMKNLYIVNNKADDSGTPKRGGAIFQNSPNNTLSNSIVTNNLGATTIYLRGSILNSTIVNNIGGVYLAEKTATLEVSNNIFWGMVTDYTGDKATSFSGVANPNAIVQNNATYNPIPTNKSWNTEGNIRFSSNVSNGDVEDVPEETVGSGPKFYKPTRFRGTASADEEIAMLDSADWRIKYNSPCLNVGKKLTNVKTDYIYKKRPQGYPMATAKYDMGAYELAYHKIVIGEGSNTNGGGIYNTADEQIADGTELGFGEGFVTEFLFQPKNDEWKIKKAYYIKSTDNGVSYTGAEVDITADLDENGVWKSKPLLTSFKLFAEWKNSSGLENIDLYYNVYATKGKIFFGGLDINDKVNIYNITGQTVYSTKVTQTPFNLPISTGIYIIRINNTAKKIVVN